MQNNYPQKAGIDTLLKTAFSYWSRTLLYQLLFSVLYLSLFFTFLMFALDYWELTDDLANYTHAVTVPGIKDDIAASEKIMLNPNTQYLSLALFGIFSFLFPLKMGFYKMYRKLDLGEKIDLADLFSGYTGVNFFIYTSYALFWIIIFTYASQTIFLGIVWVLVTLFTAPLMFFMNVRIFESLSHNIKALKMYPLEIFVSMMVAFIFGYAGLLIFFIGYLFTFPFINAMIYTLYQKIFEEKK